MCRLMIRFTIVMFVGIQFTENDGGGIALVHSKWLTPRKSEVWWPPFKQQDYFNKSIKKLKKLRGDYNKALQKLKKAEVTSDFPNGDEEPLPIKRKVIPPKRLFSSSDEEDENELRHPLPPRVKAISPLLKRKKYSEVCSGVSHKSQNHREAADLSSSSFSVLQEHEQDFNISNPDASQKSRFSQFQSQENENSTIKDLQRSQRLLEEVPNINELPTHKENTDLNKKILTLLVQIKNQNLDILHLLQQKKSATGLHLDLPADVPVHLPVDNFRDLRTLEDYLNEERISSMASYYATLGGRDITNKINTILKNLITNRLASEYSFLGSRNEKKSFQKLKIRKIVLNAVLSTCSSATENQIDDRIKVWLKHAPKRLSKQK